MMRIAINGFGRIGRSILRVFLEQQEAKAGANAGVVGAGAGVVNADNGMNIVAINDLQSLDASLHLLKYDSVHGRLGKNHSIRKISENEFELNGSKIAYFSKRNPEELPWGDLGIDLVMECTGVFKTRALCSTHLEAGAKKVLVSCPVDDADKTIVYGVNHHTLDREKDLIISNSSCTTNCLANVINAIHRKIKIVNGFVTTIHAYTGDQRLVDMYHNDLRRARAAACNIIPTSTGAAKTIGKIFPELDGKIAGASVRVPVPNVSMIDFTFTAARKITIDDINQAAVEYALLAPENVFACTDEPLVSSDFNHTPYSAVFDLSLTKVIDQTIGHVVAWYDNEWGFGARMTASVL